MAFPFFNNTIDKIEIPSAVIEKALSMAKDTYPNEFLAFFEGKMEKKAIKIRDIIFQPYIADTHSALPRIDFPLTSEVMGSIRSHPGHSNKPSRADLHFFRKTGIVHAIMKKPYTKEDIEFYDTHGDPIIVTLT